MKPQSSVSSIPRPAALACWRRAFLAAAIATALSAPCAIAFDTATGTDGVHATPPGGPLMAQSAVDPMVLFSEDFSGLNPLAGFTLLNPPGPGSDQRPMAVGIDNEALVIDHISGFGVAAALHQTAVGFRDTVFDGELRMETSSTFGPRSLGALNWVTATAVRKSIGFGLQLDEKTANIFFDNGVVQRKTTVPFQFQPNTTYQLRLEIKAPDIINGYVDGQLVASMNASLGNFPVAMNPGVSCNSYGPLRNRYDNLIARAINQAPSCDAGPDQTIQLGTSARLDASATSDDFTPFTELAFAWTILDAPAGSSALLADETTATPALKPDLAGDYLVGLTVTDGGGLSATAQTTVTAVDPAPNGSFEDGFAGWQTSGNVAVRTGPLYQPTHGEKLAVFNSADSTPDGVLSRAIATVPRQQYRLEFDAGVLAYNRDKQKLRMTLEGSSGWLTDEFTLTGPGAGKTSWTTKTYLFTAETDLVTLVFADLSAATRSIDLLIDNVRVTPLVRTLLVNSLPAPGVEIFIVPAAPPLGPKANIPTPFREFYNPEDWVYLSAPYDNSGRTFSHWLLDGEPQGVKSNLSLVMHTDHVATAVYQGGAPSITSQPVSTEAVPGGRAVFRVAATGAVPLAYQWQFDGDDIDGATSAWLEINPVGPGDAGFYQVVVSNGEGSVASDAAELIVAAGFAGIENGSFEADFQGWSVSGNVAIRSAPPYLPTDGERLAAFNAGNTAPDGTLSQLVATTPGQTYFLRFDAGVLAYNTRHQTIEVEVTGSPSLLRQSFVITGTGGGKVRWRPIELMFTADSTRTTVTFRDRSAVTNGIDLLLDNIRLEPRVERALTVENVAPVIIQVAPPDLNGMADGGDTFTRIYQDGTVVTLEAGAGYGGMYPDKTRTWSFARWWRDGVEFSTSPLVTVEMDADIRLRAEYKLDPPFIATQPADRFAAPGGSVTFAVDACGGVDSYQWRHNGVPVAGGGAATLVVAPVTAESAGGYDVLVTNAGGTTASRVATLTVIENGPFNPSFESGFDDWTVGGNVRVQQPPPGTAPDGASVVAFNAGNTTPNGWIAQIIATQPLATYRLSFEMGVLAYNTREQILRVDIDGAGPIASETYTMRGLGGGQTVWQTRSLVFIADSTAALLTFRDVSTTTNSIDLLLDHIRIEELSLEGFELFRPDWFTMGRTSGDMDANAPSVNVHLSSFYIARFEVTKALWDQVRAWGLAHGYTDLPAGGGKGPDHPVYALTWFDAVKWCNARSEMEGLAPVYSVSGNIMRTGNSNPTADWTADGYRLPTEAEWEKAARGMISGWRFPWGDTITHALANYQSTSSYSYDMSPTQGYHPVHSAGDYPYTAPVGSFDANPYGLFDMSGNVWEWCWDWHAPYVNGAIDPRGPLTGTGRVARGGGWGSHAIDCRVSARLGLGPDSTGGDLGFRLARSSVP